MIDQIRLLEQLQQIDARILDLDTERNALPSRVKVMRENVARVETLLGAERTQLTDTEHLYGDREREMKLEEEQIHKSKAKLQQVRNTKEYMATTRELETLRKVFMEREEEMVKLLEAIDLFRASTGQHDGELGELRGQLADAERSTNEHLARLDSAIGNARTLRAGISSQVRADFMKRYNQIRVRRGLAVVPVRGGTCTGCNMNLPPQLFNLVQRGDTIHTCPSCHRIVYFDPAAEEIAPA